MITDKEVLDTSRYLTELQNKMYRKIFDNIPKNPDELQKTVWLNSYGRRKRIPTNISGRILYVNKKDFTVTYTLKEDTEVIFSFEKDLSCTKDIDASDTPIVDDVSGTLVEEPLVIRSN